MFRKSIKANKNVAKAPVDGIMKKIMTDKIINKADEKELLRSTELDESIKKTLKFNETFEDVLDKNTSAHQKMENKHLKDALTNIRKMLYKMEIMLIDKNLTGNLEDVEERLIQTFVKLSQKVPDASAPAADAPIVVPPDTTANPAAAAPIVVPPDTTANPAAADDTNPIVDPDDHGPIGEEAREISGERWKAQKVMADAAAKAKAALGSAGREEAKP